MNSFEILTEKIVSTITWLPHYQLREARRLLHGEKRSRPEKIYVSVCDHYEPYCNRGDRKTARSRIMRWCDQYPAIAQKFTDPDGNIPQWSFFYPEEEYHEDDLSELAELCHAGYGEVEIHLHHDNDTADNMRRTLIDFKKKLHEKHGLLSVDKKTGEIVYGFIHGNWALCNSRRDGRWCGVNEEIKVLLETGCYADFTMPSAPSATQTRKVNCLYYAQDQPGQPKSHDRGVDAEVGKEGAGLLMVQGPLAFDWSRRKFGILPKLEYSGLLGNLPPSPARTKLWVDCGISVAGAPDTVFIKIYTHGADDNVMKMLFDGGGLERFFGSFKEYGSAVRFVSAREMARRIVDICSSGTRPT